MLATSPSMFNDVLFAGVGLVVALGIGIGIIVVIRRSTSSDGANAVPFSLQDLRDMRARGDLDDEQFAHAKAEMLQMYSRNNEGSSDRLASGGTRPDKPDPAHGADESKAP